ncbi:hypothetical protein ACSQ67_003814 [Phaseolus vulgaris]
MKKGGDDGKKNCEEGWGLWELASSLRRTLDQEGVGVEVSWGGAFFEGQCTKNVVWVVKKMMKKKKKMMMVMMVSEEREIFMVKRMMRKGEEKRVMSCGDREKEKKVMGKRKKRGEVVVTLAKANNHHLSSNQSRSLYGSVGLGHMRFYITLCSHIQTTFPWNSNASASFLNTS